MFDFIGLLCPEVAAVHADGEIELESKPPESGFVYRMSLIKRSAGRDSDENALLVQPLHVSLCTRHQMSAFFNRGSVYICGKN